MATVPVVDSLKYGLQLFGYLLGIVVIGGGGMVLGGLIAANELTDGLTASPEVFGGIVLAGLGTVIWFMGMFGLSYKLIADATRWGVASGTDSLSVTVPERSGMPAERTEPQEGVPSDSSAEKALAESRGGEPTATAPLGPSPGEQVSPRSGPAVPGAADVPDRPPSETEPQSTSVPATTSDDSDPPERQEQTTADPSDQQEQAASDPSERQEQTTADPPEPTAEEIAFGSGRDGDAVTNQTETEESQPATTTDQESQREGTLPPYESIAESTEDETRQPSVDELFNQSETDEPESPAEGRETDKTNVSAGGDEADESEDSTEDDETAEPDVSAEDDKTDPLSDPVDDEQ